MSNKLQVLQRLYKEILKESSNFKSYYYRNYFTRKTQDQFGPYIEAKKEVSDELIKESEEMLAMLKRQTMITNAFADTKLVIEEKQTSESDLK